MNQSTRRGFLALSASGVAAAAVAPSAMAAGSRDSSPASSEAAAGRFVAYVHDASSGDVALMVGEREVVVHDPQLVSALSKHAAS